MPTPITGQGISAPPKVDATLSNTSKNAVQNQAVANALAGAYDATATYAVGDLCIYDGILYECTTAITTAEAWDATHWKTGNFGEKVSDLSRQLSDDEVNEMLMNSSIPGTTETVTFDTNNKPASVTHTASGVAVRTDVFTWGTNSVTEVRTLANGKYVTLVTNLTTLVTTISEIQEAS